MTADTTRGQKIKHTFKYAEQRRTLWLNTASKDDFGRHRGAVLYGMNLVVTGAKTLKIAPGAIYTPYGTRLFFEQYQSSEKPGFNQIDLSQPSDLFNVAAKPVVACIYLKFIIDDVTQMTAVDSVNQFDTNKIEFAWRLVPYDRIDVQPVNNIRPRDPVLLDRVQAQPSEYELGCELDVRQQSVAFHEVGGKEEAAMQFGEIPLGYIIIGSDPTTNALPVDLNSPGVDIVQCRNLFATIGDVLGHDVFFGRHGRRITAGLTTGAGSALAQGFSTRAVGAETTPELMAPRYGTAEPDPAKITPSPADPTGEVHKADQDKASWLEAAWDTYRQPSFLRDGDGIVWALRRLDYVLRLWMDRTGDQTLVAMIQDGQAAGTHVRPMMTLDAILQHFKGTTLAGENLNALTYPDSEPSAGANPANHVLKSGLAAHTPQTLDGAQTTAYGDTHLQAISALDLGVWHLLGDVFGRDFARRALRRATAWRAVGGQPDGATLGGDLASITKALTHDDGPNGKLVNADANADGYIKPENKPTLLTGTIEAYLTHEPMYDALRTLAERAQAAPSNWLRNSAFILGESSGPPLQPLRWNVAGGSWTRVSVAAELGIVGVDVDFAPGAGELTQTVDFQGAILSDLLATCDVMHVGVCMRVTAGTVHFGLRGLDAANATVFDVRQPSIPVSATVDNYSFVFKLQKPLSGVVQKLVLYVGAANAASFRILNASAGPGVPRTSLGFDREYHEFLSRDGGPTSAMRGPLDMDGQDLVDANDGNFTGNVDVDGNVDVGGTARVAGMLTAESGADMNNQEVVNVLGVDTPTSAANMAKVHERMEATADVFDVTSYNRSRANASSPWVITNLVKGPIGKAMRVMVGATNEIKYMPYGDTPVYSLCVCQCQCECQCQCQCQCQCNGRCNDRSRWS